MPPGFAFPEYAEVWTPLRLERGGAGRDERDLDVVARLADGVTVEQARSELGGIARALERERPDANRGRGAEAKPLLAWLTPPGVVVGLKLLLAAGLFVQLIACANVANLLLAKSAAQRQEIAMRMALGASRGRLLRQFTVETLLVTAAGAALGLLAGDLGGPPADGHDAGAAALLGPARSRRARLRLRRRGRGNERARGRPHARAAGRAA